MRGDPRLGRLAAVAAARRLCAERRAASALDRLLRDRDRAEAADEATCSAEAQTHAATSRALASSRDVSGPVLQSLLYGARAMSERAGDAAREAEHRAGRVRAAEADHAGAARERARAIRREDALGALVARDRAAARRAAEEHEAEDRTPGRGRAR